MLISKCCQKRWVSLQGIATLILLLAPGGNNQQDVACRIPIEYWLKNKIKLTFSEKSEGELYLSAVWKVMIWNRKVDLEVKWEWIGSDTTVRQKGSGC